MPERLNICCLFDETPLDRRSVFLKLFEAEPTWMGRPSKFMVLNIKTGMMTEGDWPLSNSIAQQSFENDLLFIYSDWAMGPNRFRSSISLTETNGRAVYTLSFPVSVLQQSVIDDLEWRFFHIFEDATPIGKCTILIGSELELEPAQAAKRAILSAIDPASLASWIIAPEEYLPSDVRPFAVVANSKDAVLLRHPDAAQRVELSTTVSSEDKDTHPR
jgi:hypothetical protein